MERFVMALDAGTTSNRCILFDESGAVRGVAQKEFTQHFPKPGWVEHNPEELFDTMVTVCRQAMENAGATAAQIAAIGITNQRETTVVWDKRTGKPVYNAIVWQCRRTAEICKTLEPHKEEIRRKTGLISDPYFSGTKIKWILDNVEGARENRENLLFGTVETWLIWNLTGGVHVTDYSNASRTMLFNIHTLSWDADLLKLLNIPASMLPAPKPNGCVFGHTLPALFGGPIPIAGAIGDQQSALFGQTCFAAGSAKCTYGTGAFLLMNTGTTPIDSHSGLLTTVAWGQGGTVEYALEGSVFAAGAAVGWLKELGVVTSFAQCQEYALQAEDTGGCYIVPAFAGLGAPYWDPYARGTVVGLSRATDRRHICRAMLDGIAYQIHDVLEAMAADAGTPLKLLQVDGGASVNSYLMQTQADLCRVTVRRPGNVESTALGAAFMAGLTVGFWESKEALTSLKTVGAQYIPAMGEKTRAAMLAGWKKAVSRAAAWAEE